MKWWRWILLLVVLAALAAFGWHWVAVDPGYVLIRLRGWEVQSTLLVAVVVVIVAVLVLVGLWRLLRWPFGAVTRRHRRVARKYLVDGLVALAEGRHGSAERSLARSARLASQRGPALLAAATAQARRGDHPAALETLDKAALVVPQAARTVRARVLRHAGRPDAALALLAPEADAGKLPPAGWRELALAALAAGDPGRALAALEPMRKSGVVDDTAQAGLEGRVLTQAIRACADGAALKDLWSRLPKAQRRRPEAVDAYARRAAHFGQSMAAMHELEAALRRQWSPVLVEAWGALDGEDVEVRLRRAEAWLPAHPDDAVLLATLGQLCARLDVWGKAREYLGRALALAPTAAAWEAMGDVYAGQNNVLLSQRCYQNALRLARGEPTEPLPGAPVDPTQASVSDQRDEHGMPRLAGSEGRGVSSK